jgi:hypothetical protein
MLRTKITILALLALVFVTGCGTPEFRDFSSPEGRFKVQMPGDPQVQSQTTAGIEAKLFVLDAGSHAYTVAYSDLPMGAHEPAAMIKTRLDGARDGFVRSVGGQLKKSSEITLQQEYPGREFQADVPQKGISMRVRVYLVGPRLYQAIVGGSESWIYSEDANRFIDSFAVTP